jgi:riboflavin synthase alpha subunit
MSSKPEKNGITEAEATQAETREVAVGNSPPALSGVCLVATEIDGKGRIVQIAEIQQLA